MLLCKWVLAEKRKRKEVRKKEERKAGYREDIEIERYGGERDREER